ncbi:hypothetical protein V6N13_126535 [Hibiscus sabdariffa]
MWRIANNYMPTFGNLQGRRLNVNNVCPLCHSSNETVEHLMRDCSFVSQLHNALDMPIFQNVDMLTWFEWLAMRFCSLNESFKMFLMVSYWVVWFTRNKVVHENIVPSVTDSVAFVRSFLVECGSISTNERAISSFQPIVWEAPPDNIVKFNFDATYDSHRKRAISGVIGRDKARNILASCVVLHNNVVDALMAESLACFQSIRFVKDLVFRKVIIEGDSRTVIMRINEGVLNKSVIAPLIHGIRIAAREFENISFSFARREANIAAHVIARDYRSQHVPCY